MEKKIHPVVTCMCQFNLSKADIKRYKDMYVAVKKDLRTIVRVGKTADSAFKQALERINITELAKTVSGNVSIPHIR